jgi:glycosyltransferase involved in cell wall biosynthesis
MPALANLEAQASGVPCVVSSRGGPKFIIQADGQMEASGLVAGSPQEFLAATLDLMSHHERLNRMREAALKRARLFSWESVLERVYQVYEDCLSREGALSADSTLSLQRVGAPDVTAAIR